MAEPGVLELEDGRVDLRRGEVVRGGVSVPLTTRERELLAFLSERADTVVRRDDAHRAVWGMHARVVSRAIDNTVTRLRQKLERDPAAPRHLLTIYGVGYQWVAAAPVDDADGPFVGRHDELDAVRRRFADGARHVHVVGPGGMGKTRLLRRFAARWPHGRVVLVDLRDRDEVDAAVGEALAMRLSAHSATARQDAVREALAAEGACWVALDHTEQGPAALPTVLARWARELPELRVLTAGRAPVGDDPIALGPLSSADADRLLDALSAGRTTAEDRAHLVPRLGGWPLAVVLASRRLSLASAREIAARLDRGGVTRGPLEAAVRWSVGTLEGPVRAALSALAVLPPGFRLAHAEAVAGDGAADALEALLAAGLVHRDGPGFRIDDPVREIVAPPPDVRARAEAGLVAWAVDRAARARPTDRADRAEVLAAWDVLAVAFRWSDGADRARLAEALAPYVSSRGPIDAWIGGYEAVAEPGPSLRLARGELYRLRGHADRARAEWAVVEAGPDRLLAARARAQLGNLDRTQGRLADAEARLRAALADLGPSPLDEAVARGWLGLVDARSGRPDEARAALEVAAGRLADLGAERQLAVVVGNLGVLHLEGGRHAEAEASFLEARALHEAWEDWRNLASCASNLGALRLERGDPDGAEPLLVEAAALGRDLGERRVSAQVGLNLALLRVERRQWADAAEALRRALRALQAVGAPLEEGLAMGHLGVCRWAEGERADALHWLDRALPCTAPARVPGVRAWRSFVAGAGIDGPFDPDDPVPALLAGHPVPAEVVARSFDARLAAWARDHGA